MSSILFKIPLTRNNVSLFFRLASMFWSPSFDAKSGQHILCEEKKNSDFSRVRAPTHKHISSASAPVSADPSAFLSCRRFRCWRRRKKEGRKEKTRRRRRPYQSASSISMLSCKPRARRPKPRHANTNQKKRAQLAKRQLSPSALRFPFRLACNVLVETTERLSAARQIGPLTRDSSARRRSSCSRASTGHDAQRAFPETRRWRTNQSRISAATERELDTRG